MITLKVTLDKRRKRNNDTFPLVFKLSFKRKTRYISTGYSILEQFWDAENAQVLAQDAEHKIMLERIKEQRIKLHEKLLHFERTMLSESTTIQEIKQFLTSSKHHKEITVSLAWEEEIQRLENAKRFGNARNYKNAKTGLARVANLNIPFPKVNYNWLMEVETTLRANEVQTNSISVYMRTLRALYNKAINAGIVAEKHYPFRRYKIKSAPTTPRVANVEELQRFFDYNIPEDKEHWQKYWDYGRLIFLLRGINFTDLALLTRKNLKHGRIIYSRSKTHKSYSVKLLPLTEAIIHSYIDEKRTTLLPILSEAEFKQKKRLPEIISFKRKNCNKALKKIGMSLDIEEPLSTYVFRYSHANACKKMGYPKDMISESLGHAYGMSVSSCYLEDYDLELIDEMNAAVCKKIIEGV